MDPEKFLEIANMVSKMQMYPYFDMAHAVVSCLYIREDLGSTAHPFSRKHPFSCWISSMINIFAGTILANFLLGEPIIAAFKNPNQVAMATVIWYLIFYSPADVIYKICKFMPCKVICAAMKEVIRCRKVHDGVNHAAKIYPNGFIIMIAIGTVKGNGSGFMKLMERLMRGTWTPNAFELLSPTFSTKASIIASVIFIIDKKSDWISVPHALVYFGIVIFFVYFRLSSLLLGIHDPLVPFENIFCALFMGGIWDALAQAISKAKKNDDSSPKVEIPRRDETKKKD